MAVILGIDPGSRITGFGVIAIEKTKPVYVASGCIKVFQYDDMVDRLQQIYQHVAEVIQQHQPTEAAIEQVFMHRSPDSALKLGQARGAAIVAMANHGLAVGSYSARQVKQAVVGYGAAEKKQVQHMVTTLLSLNAAPQVDAADALAIALCHHHSREGLLAVSPARKIVGGRLR